MSTSAHAGPAPATRLAFLWLVGVQLVCLALVRTPLFEDDVLFFLRYAQNLAAGEGYRFNVGEAPVCGASAPLWPPLIAATSKLGLGLEHATLVLSCVLALGATLVLGSLLHALYGPLGVYALAPVLAVQHHYSTWSTSGMESPLTFLLVAAALWLASGRGRWHVLGTVAGLCLVHKLDLAPLGLALLAGAFLWRRAEALRATLLALALAGLWYAFATLYFGAPLPNSFTTKFGWSATLERSWFVHYAFLEAGGPLRALLALAGLWALRHRPHLALVAATQVLVPTLGYTLHPPSEPFIWYVAAISPALAFLAAVGASTLLCTAGAHVPRALHVAAAAGVLGGLTLTFAGLERQRAFAWHDFLLTVQQPMKEAGQWVAANTPPEARVYTAWGNPAYYSQRFVYDSTHLNRRREEGDLLAKYQPEVCVLHSFARNGERPLPPEYLLVKRWESGPDFNRSRVSVYLRDTPRAPPEDPRSLARLRDLFALPEGPERAQGLQHLRARWAKLDASQQAWLRAQVPELELEGSLGRD